MNYAGRLTLFALTLFAHASGASGTQVLNFRTYRLADGLPQMQVNDLHQDRRGFIWLASNAGMSRFDGREFRVVSTRDGLASNLIQELDATQDGSLVAAAAGGGVCFVDPLFRAPIECVGANEGLSHQGVYDVHVDAGDTVWVGTQDGLTQILDRRVMKIFRKEQGLPSDTVFRTWSDRRGALWANSPAGIARRGEDGRFRKVHLGIADQGVGAAFPTEDGAVFGVRGRLYRYREGEELEEIPVPGLPPGTAFRDAVEGPDGRVFFSTFAGAVVLDGDRARMITEDNGLGFNQVYRIIADRERNIWFGTDRGLSKLVPSPFDLFDESSGLQNSVVRDVAEDEHGVVWAATRLGPATFDGERFHPLPVPSEIVDPRSYSLAAPPSGGMLMGTRTGLVYYGPDGARFYGVEDGLPGPYVTTLVADDDGVWVSTGAGLARWEDGRLTPVDVPELQGVFIISSALDARGRLWLGLRSGGVVIYDGASVATLGRDQGLSELTLWDVAPDPDGHMWIGSNGEGAYHVIGDSVISVSTEDGLVDDFIWQVTADSRGEVWLFTSHGLDRLINDGEEILHYGPAHGLVDPEGMVAAGYEDSRGFLWLGGASGLYRYDPSRIVPREAPPPIYVEALRAGGVEYPLAGAELPPRSGVIDVRFSSPTFKNEEGIRFRTRLLPETREWSDARADNSVTIAGLGPGSYTLEVIAETPSGVRSATPATLTFRLLPTFWQTWWFLGGLFALVVSLVASVPFLRARRLEVERVRLEGLVREHTKELEVRAERLEREAEVRRAAEEALRESEARVRSILEHSTNLFYAHDPDLVLTYVSPQSRHFIGLGPDEAMVGLGEFITDHPVNRAGVASTRRAIETGKAQPPFELELKAVNGKNVWVLVNEAPVVEDGKVVGVVGSFTDVTDVKNAEAERERLQEQFQHAQRMEAVGRVAGGVAHDFNNLLTSILTRTQLVASEVTGDPSLEEDLREIEKSAQRGASLVSKLLGFSRRQIVKSMRVDVQAVFAEVQDLLDRVSGDKIELDVSFAEEDLAVRCDPAQLEQMLVNLTLNAVDAMPDGGRLSVAAERVSLSEPLTGVGPDEVPAGDYVEVAVSDTGGGMPAEVVEKIFEPFFTTKTAGTASGLGLSMVYGAVRQGGGYVTVESTVGSGSVIRLLLSPYEDDTDGRN